MEDMILKVLEKSLVGGAFLFLLYHNNITLTKSLSSVATTLTKISNTMIRMDLRMEQMENRISRLEEKGGEKE